jgi:sialic acid synthase SpsE
MNIAGREVGPGRAPLVVAEIGVNHDGDPRRAVTLVEHAAQAGADAVKLQIFAAELLLSRAPALAPYQERAGETDARAMLRRLELPFDAAERCVRRAHALGIGAIATVFSVELVAPSAAIAFDAFKTASPDIVHLPLLGALAMTGRPLIVSTGAATLEEVARAAIWLEGPRRAGALALLQCVSAYPTPDADAGLGAIGALARAFPDIPIGYSDHTTGADTGALAVAAGACILEKHLTHDRRAAGPDHAASLAAREFQEYARLARRAHAMLGAPVKRVQERELDVRRVARQSIVARRAIAPGQAFTQDNLTYQRPAGAFEPCRIGEVIGRTAARPIAPGESLRPEHLA